MHPVLRYGRARVLVASSLAAAFFLLTFLLSPGGLGRPLSSAASPAYAMPAHGIAAHSEPVSRPTMRPDMGGMDMSGRSATEMDQMSVRPAASVPASTKQSSPTGTPSGMTGMAGNDDMAGMDMGGTATQVATALPMGTPDSEEGMAGMGTTRVPPAPASTGLQHVHSMAGMGPVALPAAGPRPPVKTAILGGFAAANAVVLVSAFILKRMSARWDAEARAAHEAVLHE